MSPEQPGSAPVDPRNPGVSVVMATLDGMPHLQDQLSSIARQTVQPIEIVIGDDGSADGTVETIVEFAGHADLRVELVVNDHRLGYAENFMRTAVRARGNIIAFADQDDVWMDDRLEHATRALENPDLAMWISGWRCVDEGLAPIPSRRLRSGFHQRSAAAYPLYVIHGSRMVFRAELLDTLPPQGRPLSVFGGGPAHHDEWAFFAAHVMGRVHHDARPLMLYRRHANAVSAQAPSVPSRRWLLSRAGEPSSRAVADAAKARAAYLRRRAAELEAGEVRARVLASADYYDRIAPRLERRCATRLESRRSRRAIRLMAGVARGDYAPLGSDGLGFWNLMQDVYAVARGITAPREIADLPR